MKIVVIGSGISGLAAAYSILQANQDVDLKILESELRVGGIISTRQEDGCIVEEGPDSFLTTKPWALELCRLLNLQEQILQTNETNRRALIAINGELEPLPEGFMLLAPTKLYPFFDTKILSLRGKLRGAIELFQPPRTAGSDETLKEFALRRFGQEMFERIVQPMVGGIYTGDPAQLSAPATIPQFVEMERKYGSVAKGLLNNVLTKFADSGARYSAFVTLQGGLQTLTETLADAVGRDRFEMGCRVQNLSSLGGQARRTGASTGAGRWRITVDDSFNSSQQRQDFDADIVVLSTPAKALGPIMHSTDASIAADLSKVQYSSSAVLNMLFDASDIDQTINGFGFVVPEIEKRSILACSFSSTKFAGRVPPNKVLLRVFIGGVLHPELFELSDGELIQTALHDLRAYLQISRYPNKVWIKRWPKAMPQYNLGHFELVQNLKQQFAAHEGLVWCGSALTGVGIPDCVRAGFESAKAVQELIGKYRRSTVSV